MTPAEERLVFESLQFLIEHCIRRGVKKDDGEYDFSDDDQRRLELSNQLNATLARRPKV